MYGVTLTRVRLTVTLRLTIHELKLWTREPGAGGAAAAAAGPRPAAAPDETCPFPTRVRCRPVVWHRPSVDVAAGACGLWTACETNPSPWSMRAGR